ncbi:cyclic nucleotide-binding domain protein (macronuclear) [Tetrahymena thermophila SB210]|uniref:Cyclic nucleotide-binding domain protein n=1 Tax=Tetrahymena thermophila (strain SB210) TaxID=312017 RepID=Q22MX8_TETTS|nr:cyclic nucleotide-binding domain protein [Tetrahymena thermophila SB210]EAR86490.2 cyclic nucleotide-binding domain protein [Tetrahymena thermophila SB210]|eukprot:XP_976892.2 cyclic nucleotide-binding domain protein [Tetrahymena thermophila SB210]
MFIIHLYLYYFLNLQKVTKFFVSQAFFFEKGIFTGSLQEDIKYLIIKQQQQQQKKYNQRLFIKSKIEKTNKLQQNKQTYKKQQRLIKVQLHCKMTDYHNLIQEYQNGNSTMESKQRAFMKAIYQTPHFYNMIKRQEDKINRLVSAFKIREFNRKDIVYRHKQPVKEIYWILEGQMSCWDKKTDQDINTEMKLTGMYEQFIASNNMDSLARDQQEKFQNIQIRLKYLRDPELDQMIREIDTQREYFLLSNICSIKRVRFLEAGEIAGENCANSGLKYDGLCVVSSEKCIALSLSTEEYNHIFTTNKDCFYFIKEALQQIFGFSNQRLINRLAYQFEVINYQYNQVIYNEGDIADCVYVIKSGEVEIVKTLSLAQLQQQDILSGSNQINQDLIQNKDKNVEISTSYQVQGSTNQAVLKHVQNCEISKYKRKLKPKVMETQIVLKNQGLLGLEDYVQEACEMQPEKDIEESIKPKKKNGDLQEKKKKLRYVKAISKSNDTVLLKIRDKYINNLLNEQGINRHKVSEKMKILKLQYHSERLQKIHEIKSQNNQQNNTGQGGVITDLIAYNNYYENSNINISNNNNNTTNNIPLNKFISNQSNNFNYSQESDEKHKNTQLLKKQDTSQSQLLISSLVSKSNIHFGKIPDRRSSDEENYNSNKTAPANDKEDASSASKDKIYSFTPQSNRIAQQREALKNLQQLDIKGSVQNKYFAECNSAEPILASYSRKNMKKFTDYSSVSTTTTASLNSMQKLSPTLSIPINSYQKFQSGKQMNLNGTPSNVLVNSPTCVPELQQRMNVQRQRPSKTFTDINSNSMQSQREGSTSPMPCLHPLIASEKFNSQKLQETNKKISSSSEFIKDTNLFYSTNFISKNQSMQQLQQTDLISSSYKINNNNNQNNTNKEELNLLFLLPEKTKLINQKRQNRQKTDFQQNGSQVQLKFNSNKANANEQCKKSFDSKLKCNNQITSNIASLADLDNLQLQQSIQEYLPDTVSSNPIQEDQKQFFNRLKGIHPVLKKCKTLIFTNDKISQVKDCQTEQQNDDKSKKVQQQQDTTTTDSSTQCISSDRTNMNKTEQKTQKHRRIQISDKQDINMISEINCVPLLKNQKEQIKTKQTLYKDNFNSFSAKNLNTHNCDPQQNQKNTQQEKGDYQTPINIISYKQQNELYVDSGYCQNKKKNVAQDQKNANALEMLRRSNTTKQSKNNIFSTSCQDPQLKSKLILSNSLSNLINSKPMNHSLQVKDRIVTQE